MKNPRTITHKIKSLKQFCFSRYVQLLLIISRTGKSLYSLHTKIIRLTTVHVLGSFSAFLFKPHVPNLYNYHLYERYKCIV